MAKTGRGLVDFAASKVGKVPYVYGCKGETLTAALYAQFREKYGASLVWDSDKAKIGQVCCDCSGLISWFTGILRSSQEFHDAAKKIYPISTVKDAPAGALVWKQNHIGIYVGIENGVPMYIAEDGSAVGCRKMPLPGGFTNWFLCVDIQYSENIEQLPSNAGAIAVGGTVRIKAGAVYGGLDPRNWKPVPDSVIARAHTVERVARGEALLREINSWVSLDYLTRQ